MTLPEGVTYQEFAGESALATKGDPVYGEATTDGWRRWDPTRSKLGAIFDLEMETGLSAGDSVLYLGAANGTTTSHVADFAGPTYAIEFAPRPVRDLLTVAESRENLVPLLADARHPEEYGHVVESNVDAIVQDVATRGQARVAVENARFLAPDGHLAIAIKARSENVTRRPEDVFEDVLDELESTYEVLATERLEPYHTDHLAVIATPR